MPDVSLNGIEFVIKGSSDEASESVDKLTEKLNGLKTALSGVSSVSKFSVAVKNVGDSAKKATSPLNNFLASIKRIAFYRMIRTVIKEIAEAIKEGAQSFYDFTKKVNPQFTNYAKALDGVKAASAQMKNQLGAAFGSLYTAIAPIITSLISLVTRLANALTMIFARLSGASGWYRATEASADAISDVGGAAKEALKYLATFDELNRLPSNNGGGGGGGGSPSGGYEWVDFDTFDIGDGIKDIVNWFTESFSNIANWIENVDWQDLGKAFYTKLNETLTSIDWGALASSIFEFLGAALGAAVGFRAGILEGIWEDIKTAFHNLVTNDDGTKKTGEEIVLGILEGIHNAITNIGTWISENILGPFIEGFCKAFGIASPAKEMEEPGRMIGEGILAGIKAPFEAIGTWIDEHILQPIKKAFGSNNALDLQISINIPAGIEDRINKIKAAFEKVKNAKATLTPKIASSWSTAKQKALEKLGDAWGKIKEVRATLTATLSNNVNMNVLNTLSAAWGKIQSVKATFTASLSASNVVKNFIDAWNKLGNKGLEIKASLADNIKGAWNKMATAWNSNGLLKKLYTMPTLAKGGMLNAGQMFIARESGPEIVGQFGSKTGVMNNQQIVAAVSNGVANAIAGLRFSVSSAPQTTYVNNDANEESMYRAMLRALNAADREIEVNLDGEPIYRGVVNRNRKETFRTGVNPMMSRA